MGGYRAETGTISVGDTPASASVALCLPVEFSISGGSKTYNGAAQGVEVAAAPPARYAVRYNGSAEIPRDAGTYAVSVEADEPGYAGSATAALTIARAPLTAKADDKAMDY
ncbi:MAG: MBG domain-containing protein, partial [Clostridiales bacterium]|nr:MBG domain-containing protein [Clostridiales bacterium]